MLSVLLAGSVLIGATLSGGQVADASASFKDVPSNHWAKSSIDTAVAKGYFKGYSDGTFRPNANITRAEFAVLMSRISNNKVNEGNSSFSDIKGHWAESGINKAIGMGYISKSDYPNGFKPGTSLTRKEMAKWMASGLATNKSDFKQALSDTKDTLVPVAEYHKGGLNKTDYPYVSVVLGTGLMAGYPDGTFGPSKTTTRAEVAVILARLEQVQNKQASSFKDLNEMREVGLTGTNLLAATPYEYTKHFNSNDVSSFDRFANKPYNMLYNRGKMTVHRMIVVDAETVTNHNNIYGKMFMDKDFDRVFKSDYYAVFLEATVVPNDNTSLTNAAFSPSTVYNFTKAMSFYSGTLNKYGIKALPSNTDYLKSGFFKKDVPRRFWMVRNMPKEWVENYSGTMGVGSTLVSFSIPNK